MMIFTALYPLLYIVHGLGLLFGQILHVSSLYFNFLACRIIIQFFFLYFLSKNSKVIRNIP
ncbi:hypothetical protein RchiOBHm_Chr7g0224661 [Rosa chinensis]|uniref:Uncharacterized protein n=1 Tax=Rosa chinensis TaxID=74649 RepID=A0A2P6PDW0_ROSCH|nr:hypothetical protein RchiOBHm_Chr7g0224661 [Rosa chinensis]